MVDRSGAEVKVEVKVEREKERRRTIHVSSHLVPKLPDCVRTSVHLAQDKSAQGKRYEELEYRQVSEYFVGVGRAVSGLR